MKHNLICPALASLALCACAEEQKSTPNIIYILADDLGYGDIGCFGQEHISTPNIDRLAEEGMLFTQHYAGCAVSAPSRSTLPTGLHTGHTPIRGNREMEGAEGQFPMADATYTVGEFLQDNGYATAVFGKWGLGYPGSEGAPNNQGFDLFFGYNCQRMAHRYYPEYLRYNDEKYILEGNDTKSKAIYAPDVIQERTLEFIRDNRDNPFFAYVAIVQPHAELVVPDDEILAQYKGKFEETPYVAKRVGSEYGDPKFDYSPFASQETPRAVFAAMVARIDRYVGEIMEEVEKLGIADNTLIIFTSDNGPHTVGGGDPDFFNGNGPHRGYKRDLTDGGIRVPMIARWSGTIKEGSRSEHISAFWDFMPTVADLIGVESPESDGLSYLPELLGQEQPQHEFLYWEFKEKTGSLALRMGDWKAIRYNVNRRFDQPIELYNIVEDPEELNNVSAQHPDIVARAAEIFAREHVKSDDYPFKYEVAK